MHNRFHVDCESANTNTGHYTVNNCFADTGGFVNFFKCPYAFTISDL